MNKKVLVLGNARDRLNQSNFIKNWKYDIFVCNYAYKEINDLPTISVCVSVHESVAKEALIFKTQNNFNFEILSPKKSEGINSFNKYRGWSSGTEAIQECILRGYEEIYTAGFEFTLGEDLYQPQKLYCGNFEKQFNQIISEFPGTKIIKATYDNKPVEKKEYRTIKQNMISQNISFKENTLMSNFLNNYKENDTVLIIGNSPVVLEKEFGKKIDKYDLIVRINDYIITDFEKYIGSKTTFWSTGGSHATKIINRNIDKLIPLLFIPAKRLEREENLSKAIKDHIGIDIEKLNLIPFNIIKQLQQIVDMDYLSTGLMTILYFKYILKMNVIIYGFCEYRKHKAHYYDNQMPQISSLHDFKKEFMFINSLISRKEIYELTNLLEG